MYLERWLIYFRSRLSELVEFATMGSAVVLIATAFLAWEPVLMTKKYPEKYKKAKFKLSLITIYIIAVIRSVSSIILVLATVRIYGKVWLFIIAWFIPGIIIYFYNKKRAFAKIKNQRY